MTPPRLFASLCLLSLLAAGLLSAAQAEPSPENTAFRDLGGSKFENWTGLQSAADGEAAIAVPGQATFRVPDGGQGWHRPQDLALEYDGVIDARPWYGLRFDAKLEGGDRLDLDLAIHIPAGQERHDILDGAAARVVLQGTDWQSITVPLASFDYPRGQVKFLKYLKELTFSPHAENGENGAKTSPPTLLKLRHLRLVKAAAIDLSAPILSWPADQNGAARYEITVTNCTADPQTVALSLERSGWEGMAAEISPRLLSLSSGESHQALIQVQVPSDLPAGAHEIQTVVATPQNGSATPAKLLLTTLQRLPFPFLVHDAAGWQGVRDKVQKYAWAQEQAAETIKKADAWQVPEPFPGNHAPDGTLCVFRSYLEGEVIRCALAWRLTGDAKYAEKLALFLRRFADPEHGYPKTLHANSQGIPQEGGFFEGATVAYEAAVEAGLLTPGDRQQIEHSLRLYIRETKDSLGDGGISNWSVYNLAPAAMCALVLQDLQLFDDLLHGPCGLVDQLRYGTMDDGWWYEMSLAYNLGCAEVYTKLALAARPFGIDLLHEKFPVALTKKVGLRPFEFENFEGMAFGKYGPLRQNTLTLQQMWDGITPYPDYRGVMFGMGDGHEHTVGGGPFELAYFAYRDPRYASIVRQGGQRDLVYGVPDLPENPPTLHTQSSFSENAGIAVLRSQTAGREPREQIQAAVKYGTHGGYHGHFDRISLLSLMRYGRSFFNPETSWFGYGNYLYKWWVQPSLAHNMVVVDAKQQEPQECRQTLFHSGKMLQALAVETTARWSNPPYFGGYAQIEKVQAGDAPYVFVPDTHPNPGEVTDYTEPVRQRRLTIVTDDYVVLADALQGEKEHTFDQLMHLRGATLPGAKVIGHSAQFDTDPLGSGQFITNVDHYRPQAPAIIHSIHRIAGSKRADDSFARTDDKNWETGGAKSLSEPGVLNIDEHVLWPQNPEVAIGSYAESWNINKKVSYTVSGGGQTLASGTFGAWILGSGAVDVDVTGLDQLELQTTVARGKETRKTLFWADARILLRNGTEIALSDLPKSGDAAAPRIPSTAQNILPTAQAGLDYEGGPIIIAGNPVTSTLAAEPDHPGAPGLIRLNLQGLDAVRFQATLGGDFPVGDQEQLRKTCSVTVRGREARFLTLLEPYEKNSAIRSATALSPDQLRVELKNGTIQEIEITHFSHPDQPPQVKISETKDGKIIREETTAQPE